MNNIMISGKVEQVYDMTSGIVLVSLKNEEGTFSVFWFKNSFDIDSLENSFLVVKGRLTYITVKMSLKQSNKKLIAIEAGSIEKYDI